MGLVAASLSPNCVSLAPTKIELFLLPEQHCLREVFAQLLSLRWQLPLTHLPECVFVLAETGALTVHAVFTGRTHPVPAVWPAEARLAQAASVDVVAACTVRTVTHTFTVLTVRACSTLLIAPEGRNTGGGGYKYTKKSRTYGESCTSLLLICTMNHKQKLSFHLALWLASAVMLAEAVFVFLSGVC